MNLWVWVQFLEPCENGIKTIVKLSSPLEKNHTMALASSLMDGIARMLYRAPFTYGRIYKLLFKISIHYTIKINHIKYHFSL